MDRSAPIRKFLEWARQKGYDLVRYDDLVDADKEQQLIDLFFKEGN